MKRIITALFLAAACWVSGAVPAFAHAHLTSASPPVGGEASTVTDVRLSFSEGLEIHFSSVVITGPDGKPVDAPKATLDPADGKIMVIHLSAPLPPGTYHVSWIAVSVDTHRTQGAFDFTVKP